GREDWWQSCSWGCLLQVVPTTMLSLGRRVDCRTWSLREGARLRDLCSEERGVAPTRCPRSRCSQAKRWSMFSQCKRRRGAVQAERASFTVNSFAPPGCLRFDTGLQRCSGGDGGRFGLP